jgi:hypothetical protein
MGRKSPGPLVSFFFGMRTTRPCVSHSGILILPPDFRAISQWNIASLARLRRFHNMLGIPSGPGALFGLAFPSTFFQVTSSASTESVNCCSGTSIRLSSQEIIESVLVNPMVRQSTLARTFGLPNYLNSSLSGAVAPLLIPRLLVSFLFPIFNLLNVNCWSWGGRSRRSRRRSRPHSLDGCSDGCREVRFCYEVGASFSTSARWLCTVRCLEDLLDILIVHSSCMVALCLPSHG